MIKLKRIYEAPEEDDGFRILVDRLWPRGLGKEEAKVEWWVKEIAPSHELRKWYAHDPQKWSEFKKRYFLEIGSKKEAMDLLIKKARQETITLLFSSREEKRNNAVALKEYLLKEMKK